MLLKKVHVKVDAPARRVRVDRVLLLHPDAHQEGPVGAVLGPEAARVRDERAAAAAHQGFLVKCYRR